jgi:hypothetical protein
MQYFAELVGTGAWRGFALQIQVYSEYEVIAVQAEMRLVSSPGVYLHYRPYYV